ncbi:MAG: TlpA family protein disulfide reductase [Sphingopyxis sp.]|nr:TlpA family protein disulfide reductase [Sphingopyxis sp.]
MTRSFTRPLSAFVIAGLMLAVGGCDTQSSAPSQGSEAARPQVEDRTGKHGNYRIDRSRAGTMLSSDAVQAPDGSSRTLATLTGKPVLLNLWATWCAPCIVELPTLEALATAKGDAAHIVLLSQDLGEREIPTQFLAERSIATPQNWHDPENAVGLAVGGQLPTTILYDAQGREVLRVIGVLDWAGEEAVPLLTEAGFGT